MSRFCCEVLLTPCLIEHDMTAEQFPLQEAWNFLQSFAWLAEFRIVDFLLNFDEVWDNNEQIPLEWRTFVSNLSDDDYLPDLLSLTAAATTGTSSSSASVPLTSSSAGMNEAVSSFVRDCRRFSLRRLPAPGLVEGGGQVGEGRETQRRNNMKLKKTYEIETISGILKDLMKASDLFYAVDIGAGQGYLAMELIHCHPDVKRIYAIECSDVQIHGLSQRISCQETSAAASKIEIKQCKLDSNRDAREFEELLLMEGKDQKYLMYSLHACGSLSETMIELFCHPSSRAAVLFNVACCYNLIDETLPGRHFPMSRRVSSLSRAVNEGHHHKKCNSFLSRNVRMVACQSPQRWIHRPAQTQKFFKRHFYRALLELVLRSNGLTTTPDQEFLKISSVPDGSLKCFADYWQAAVPTIPIPTSISLQEYERRYKPMEKILSFMWTMRALLGPVVEGVILVDRYWYIREQRADCQVDLVPVLDPLQSPRNFVLQAVKRKNA
jgi:hypothetical protein